MHVRTIPLEAASAHRYRALDAETVAQLSVFFSLLGALAGCALLGYFLFWKPLIHQFIGG